MLFRKLLSVSAARGVGQPEPTNAGAQSYGRMDLLTRGRKFGIVGFVAALLATGAAPASVAQTQARGEANRVAAKVDISVTVVNLAPSSGPGAPRFAVSRDFLSELPIYIEVAAQTSSTDGVSLGPGASAGWLSIDVRRDDGKWRRATLRPVKEWTLVETTDGPRAPEANLRLAPGTAVTQLLELRLPGGEMPSPGRYALRISPSRQLPKHLDLATTDALEIDVLPDAARTEEAALEQAAEAYLRLGVSLVPRDAGEALRFLQAARAATETWLALREGRAGALPPGTAYYTAYRVASALGDSAAAHAHGLNLMRCASEDCELSEALFGANSGKLPRNFADDLSLRLQQIAGAGR
jgi:hypothetical protein